MKLRHAYERGGPQTVTMFAGIVAGLEFPSELQETFCNLTVSHGNS